MVNFWAGNCYACRIEIPHLQSLYNEYKDVTTVGIGLGNDIEEIKRFVDRTDITYPAFLSMGGKQPVRSICGPHP